MIFWSIFNCYFMQFKLEKSNNIFSENSRFCSDVKGKGGRRGYAVAARTFCPGDRQECFIVQDGGNTFWWDGFLSEANLVRTAKEEKGKAGSTLAPVLVYVCNDEAPPTPQGQVARLFPDNFSWIIIHRWRNRNDPRYWYHNRMTIRSSCCWAYSSRTRWWWKITSPEQERRCCQREKYCDLFHGIISIIE